MMARTNFISFMTQYLAPNLPSLYSHKTRRYSRKETKTLPSCSFESGRKDVMGHKKIWKNPTRKFPVTRKEFHKLFWCLWIIKQSAYNLRPFAHLQYFPFHICCIWAVSPARMCQFPQTLYRRGKEEKKLYELINFIFCDFFFRSFRSRARRRKKSLQIMQK